MSKITEFLHIDLQNFFFFIRFCHDVVHYLFTKMTEESFLSILLYFSLLHDLFSMYCWGSNRVLLPLNVSMFTEFVFDFGSCLSLKIFKCRNSPVCSVSPKMDQGILKHSIAKSEDLEMEQKTIIAISEWQVVLLFLHFCDLGHLP